MNTSFSVLILSSLMGLTLLTSETIYSFSESSSKDWFVVDDGVMGGLSRGNFKSIKEGTSVFWGTVSLENNGGFSSVRYRQSPTDVSTFSKFILKIKGDGKDYQFRVKSSSKDYYSYVYTFPTSGEWQEVIIPFDQMIPSFRGRILDQPPFPGKACAEMAFLIANKKAESFALEMKEILVERPQ